MINKSRLFERTSAENPHIRLRGRCSARLSQYLHGCLVNIDEWTRADLTPKHVQKRPAGMSCLHRPVAHGRTGKINTQTAELPLLPVERQGITELGRKNVGQKPCSGDTFFNDLLRCRGDLDHRPFGFYTLAVLAGVFGPDMPDNSNDGRDDIQLFRNILTDLAHLTAANTGLFFFRNIVHHLNPGKTLGQLLPAGFLPGMGRDFYCFLLRLYLRLRHIKKRQLHGRGIYLALFALLAEDPGIKQTDLFAKKVNFPFVAMLLRFDNPLQFLRVIRQCGGSAYHGE